MTNTVLLKDLMNTCYMINALNGRFTNVLNKCIDDNVTVDLAHCRFGPSCALILKEYYGKVDFCNSEDNNLDKLLKDNNLTAKTIIEDYPILSIKGIEDISTYIDMVNDLPMNSKYTIELGLTSAVDKATLVLLMMTRPDIEYDLRSCSMDVFDFVRDMWVSSAEHHNSYYELIAPNVVRRNPNAQGKFGDDTYGWYQEDYFIRNRKVLPVEFGNTQIIKLDSSSTVSDEWFPVVEKCLNLFETIMKKNERVPGKTLRNFLTFREV